MNFCFRSEEMTTAYMFGKYEDILTQIERLIHEDGNEVVIYTSELCRIMGIEPPKRKETEADSQPSQD